MTSIQAPTNCPSCSSVLEWSNHLLYCYNSSCPAQSSKKLEHFAKTMKIKGLGPAAISKLDIVDIDQLYSLSEDEIAVALSSKRLAERLYAEIQKSKDAPLNLVLPAFSIPLIGRSATEKLSTVVNNLFEINTDSCERAGLGPKATENLLDWIKREYYGFYDGALPFSYAFEKSSKPSTARGTVCISGKLSSFKNKAEAATLLSGLGYTVKSSLTKDVTILVNESGIESAKTKQARDNGLQIITNLKTFIGEH
jgi:NAD-dependent DNA ligase